MNNINMYSKLDAKIHIIFVLWIENHGKKQATTF